MIEELQFVRGAIAKKSFLPELNHFKIEAGRITSFNGSLALSSPIPLDINCSPLASSLVSAINNCDSTVSISMTENKRLAIKSGNFKAFIKCLSEVTPHVEPEGKTLEIGNGELLMKALKTVAPFIGDDASRTWSNGVLLREESAYATNNTALIQYWIGTTLPFEVNIPRNAVNEMIRIGKPPTHIQLTNSSISFHYEDAKWLRTSLLNTDWPSLHGIMEQPSQATAINPILYEGLDNLKPFLEDSKAIFIGNGEISTSAVKGEGASFAIEALEHEASFTHNALMLLQDRATSIDFTTYPNPCLFFGENLRGAIIGLRI